MYLLFTVGFNTVDGDLYQNKIFVPLFGAANAAPNKGTAFLYLFSDANFFLLRYNIPEVEFHCVNQHFHNSIVLENSR